MSVDVSARPRNNTIPPEARELVSEDDAAELLSLSKPTFRKYVALGLIARVELPCTRRNLYSVAELHAFTQRLGRTSAVRPLSGIGTS